MPIRGNPSFPPDHAAFVASQAPLPINYIWEDAHPWEILPSAIFPSGYPSRPPTAPPFSIPCMYAPINSQYILFVKCAVPENANKNTKKIWLDTLHKSTAIPLKTP